MREFVVKRGKFEGIHKIYDNESECKQNESVKFIRKPWHSQDTKAGEWCIMDDGFIAQCLHRYTMPDKRGTEIYRFAFGSKACYQRITDNTRVTPLLYTTNPSSNKSAVVSDGYDRELGGTLDHRKRLWVELVADGTDPLEATLHVYKGKSKRMKLSSGRLISMTNKLIRDTKARKYLMKQLMPFKELLEERLMETTGTTLTEAVANTVAKMIETEPKRIGDMSTKIKLLIEVGQLTGDLPQKTGNRKLDNAQEVAAEEVLPPALSEI